MVGVNTRRQRARHVIKKHGRFVLHVTKRMLSHSAEIAIALAVISVIAQFLYPVDRALPLTRLGDSMVGGATKQEVARQLDNAQRQAVITVKTPNKELKVAPQTLGISVRRDATADMAVQYQWWERVLPFSAAVRVMQSADAAPLTVVDEQRMQAFAQKLVAEDALAAHDAAIFIKDGQVKVDPAKDGYKFTVDSVRRQLMAAPVGVTGQDTLVLTPERIPPRRDTASLQTAATQAETLLHKHLILKVADKTFTPSRAQIGEWLSFTEDPASQQTSVTINDDKIRAYLEHINTEIAISPGKVTVTLLDGQEVARTSAPEGRSVAVDDTVARIREQLQAGGQTAELTLPVASVPPTIEYKRTYSNASSGLQAIIADWERETYGDYGVIVREIGGQGRYAEWQADKPFVPASTYKMFLLYAVLTRVEEGKISMNQTTDIGWTVDDCIHEMILQSTNPCAVSLQNMVGWQESEDIVRQAGFTATRLNNYGGGEKTTTVRDEANYLLRLHSGTLLRAEHNQFILDLFKRQVWRGGIPSGVPRGTTVADKVGFYNGWVHDVAIVYGPSGSYILAIMSKGGNDAAFANLSRRVYNFFNDNN